MLRGTRPEIKLLYIFFGTKSVIANMQINYCNYTLVTKFFDEFPFMNEDLTNM